MACTDGRLAPQRIEISYNINDPERGTVRFEFVDRTFIDDLTIHLVRRELFRVVGGQDPGDDVNQNLKDFLVRDNFLEVR